jgi:SagB-type dehydrogenase family enzyme
MPQFHQDTNHSYMSIRKNSFFLDWRTQPKNFKTYPHFQARFKIDDFKELENLNLIGGITYEKSYPEGKYYLRTNPSAGGLYPCEIYLQIRGIEGLLSGIYHYEPLSATLCLLYEIDSDGVEYYFKNKQKQKGITFLISSIYFRSSWKYRDRAIRYILLDSGHSLGAIYATMCVMNKDSKIVFDFDKVALNDTFGFRDDEMFTVALSSTISSEQETKQIKERFPFVSGCDFLETNDFIEDAYKKSVSFQSQDIEKLDFFDGIDKVILKNAILNRRSIRAFRQISISNEEFRYIMRDIFQFASEHHIDIFYTVHRVEDELQGLYKNNGLIKEGDFSKKSRYLSLEQKIGGESAVTFYFTSNENEAYQKVTILSGFLAHIIYLKSELQGIGCTGIGAYYDDETKEFLGTKNSILYLLAIGR